MHRLRNIFFNSKRALLAEFATEFPPGESLSRPHYVRSRAWETTRKPTGFFKNVTFGLLKSKFTEIRFGS